MKNILRAIYLYLLPLTAIYLTVTGCGPSPEQQATLTSTAQTATAAIWTDTPSPTYTFTFTFTPSETFTPTITETPTITPTPTITFTPTFDFPKVNVNKPMAACLFGPAKVYLWAYDLVQGDKGVVWGRAAASNWLYVKMDRRSGPCWLSPAVVDVTGDIKKMAVQPVRLPITNALYKAPQNVKAERDGDQVTVTWDEVWMSQDDDQGYFLDVWVCQNGQFVWMPVGLPDQYHTSATFTDQSGCSKPSGGNLYTVEKHGYTDPVKIPWPPYQ